ncbi:MAG: hypothetical protein HY721_30330 [Planctomycetes bacterium]|nr:hypothetical protein [Planctomycetota bacterium]
MGTLALLTVCASGAMLAPAGRADPLDFIRGDTNSDRTVSISDAAHILGWFFLGGPTRLECESAGDLNEDGVLDISDPIHLLIYLFRDPAGRPVPPPFPAPGPDPTPDDLGCAAYGNGTPLEDPAAEIRIIDAAAPGGDDAKVVITVAVSSTGAIAGYSLALLDGGVLTANGDQDPPGFRDLSPFPAKPGGFIGGRFEDGKILFGTLTSFTEPKEIPPGDDVALVEIVTCVKEGTPAGDYPLALEAGELAAACGTECPDTGRAIHPVLTSGVLTVEQDVLPGAGCETYVPPPPPPIYILFKLEDRDALAGGDVAVPFVVKADRHSTGFSYSIRFDGAILQCTGTRQLWRKPDGTPYEFVKYEWNNETGFAVGAAVISLSDSGEVLPPNVETAMLEIGFHVAESTPSGTSTLLEFEDGGRASGGPVRNKLIAGGQEITPGLASSFVFVDGRVNIVPDGSPFLSPFVRGDSNDDEVINISDPQFTLSALFLGGSAPRCEDAADANDDGRLDISDPVATLQFLFLGGSRLPLPFPRPGLDPTGDGLRCPPR